MTVKNIKGKAVSGFLWTLIDKLGSQLIGFLITTVLARMLSPKEFGLVAMATVFFSISRTFIDGGLRDSLIQKKDTENKDYNTVFLFNVAVGVLIYCIIFLSAPAIAAFYREEQLTTIVRIVGLNVLIFPFSVVQIALITKALKFKTLVKIRVPATLLSGVVGLLMAWQGFGVYALVGQLACEALVFNILLWLTSSWRPSLEFDKEVFRFHWIHGSRLLLADIMGAVYRNIFALMIGKFYSATQLGFYNRADTFKVFAFNNTVGLIQTVSYPVLAHVQDDSVLLKRYYRKIFQSAYLVILPVLGSLMLFAKPVIEILLTEKWLPAAPILVVLAGATILSPFNSINLNVLKVKRRTDLLLRAEMLNKLIMILIVSITVNFGFKVLIYSNIIIAIISLFTNSYFTNKVFTYRLAEQIKDLFPILLAFISSFATVYFVQYYFLDSLSNWMHLIIGGLIFIAIYNLIIFAINRTLVSSLIELIRPKKTLG